MPEYIVEVSSIDDFGWFYRADPKPIVRCKECKHSAPDEEEDKDGRFCFFMHTLVGGDDFCSWGERSQDDSN